MTTKDDEEWLARNVSKDAGKSSTLLPSHGPEREATLILLVRAVIANNELLTELIQTNKALVMAMREDGGIDSDEKPAYFMDGTRVR